jgi:hypothetical protein
MSVGREKKVAFPLQPVIIECPFQQWGLDVIGEINPNSSQLHKYILTTTDYFTRWSEAIPLKTINENQVTSFLESHIITRFGIPDSLVFDNAKYFSSLKLTEFSLEQNIKVKYSTNYYPQGNGLAESTNKNLIKILKKIVNDHQRNWHLTLQNALWDDRVTPKSSIGNSPFFLVYGQEATVPTHTFLPTLQLAQSSQDKAPYTALFNLSSPILLFFSLTIRT